MELGKLTNQQMEEILFRKIKRKRTETILGPAIGADCALADFGDNYLVISADPITGTEKGIGRLCVNICCNDIAAAGGEPVGMLVTMLIPPTGTIPQIEEIIDDLLSACEDNGIDLIGGHTEISSAVNRFVLSGVSLGKRPKLPFLTIKSGDRLVMSKTAGIEGTAIIAAEKREELQSTLSDAEIDEAIGWMKQTSVIAEGIIGRENQAIMMHDATEGGVLGAVWEMAENLQMGIEIELNRIPVHKLTKKICNHFQLDPMRLISSGVMLFAVADANKLIDELKLQGIPAVAIGTFINEKKYIIAHHTKMELLPPKSDELYRVLK